MNYNLYHGKFLIGTIDNETHEVTPNTTFSHTVVLSFIRVGGYSFQPVHNMFGITHYEVVYVKETI